ncbi:MAG TPA: PepSY domain-containing protein [Blastocatellia bacterium]|nr:PepSY domain-containing protein [Blastocatellia bacterium]
MLQVFSQIVLALGVAVSFQMTAWAGENTPINRITRPVAAVASQENVPIDRLPSPVTAAIKNRFPKSELLSAEKDWENGRVKYEVKVRSDGQNYDVDVTPSGKILKVEFDRD